MTPHLRDFLLLLPVYALALARLTRLATEDKIFGRPRTAVQNWLAMHRHPMLLTLSDCPWCLSVWLAAPAVAAAWWWTYQPAPVVIAAGLGLSHVAGLLHNYSSAHAALARQAGLVADQLEVGSSEQRIAARAEYLRGYFAAKSEAGAGVGQTQVPKVAFPEPRDHVSTPPPTS